MATPTFELIETVTTAGSTSSVTFSSIPSGYKHLVWMASGETYTTSTFQALMNSSSSNSYRVYFYGSNSSAVGNDEPSAEVGYNGTVSSPSSYFFKGTIFDYRSNNYKTMLVQGGTIGSRNSSGATTISKENTSAITSLQISINGAAGTTYSLWGLVG